MRGRANIDIDIIDDRGFDRFVAPSAIARAGPVARAIAITRGLPTRRIATRRVATRRVVTRRDASRRFASRRVVTPVDDGLAKVSRGFSDGSGRSGTFLSVLAGF